jgi:putative transposase
VARRKKRNSQRDGARRERFNRSYREGVLDPYLFGSIEEVRRASAEWMEDYNWERPHDSLGRVPPLTFLPRPTAIRESTLQLST